MKYRKKEREDKTLRELLDDEGVAEVTAKEEGRVKIRSVTMKHCFEGGERHETARRRKTPRWLLCTFKERRRNKMKGKIYLKQLPLRDTFAV